MKTKLDYFIENFGIDKINTMTKYPSILTYHNLGPRGSLVNSLVEDKNFHDNKIFLTEKVDGSNTRIVFFTNFYGQISDYFIGTREDILYACGDRIINQSQHAVATVKNIADDIVGKTFNSKLLQNTIYCLYGENYGGNINGFKQYTSTKTFNIRFFDLSVMSYDTASELLENNIDRISSWREHGGQDFVPVDQFNDFCKKFSLERVPYIKETVGTEIPNDLQGVWDWMQQFKTSNAVIDSDYNGTRFAEGVVVRTADRKMIRKIRFEDYERTKRIGLIY